MDSILENAADWLQQKYGGNTVANYLWAIAILLVGWFLKETFSALLSRGVFRLVRRGTENVPLSEFIRLIKPPFEFLFFLLLLYIASEHLTIPAQWGWAPVKKFGARLIIHKLYLTVLFGGLAWLGVRIIKFGGLVFIHKAVKTESKIDNQLVPFFRDLCILLFVLTIGFIMLGQVFEVDVLTLVTSLGIGGLAIALAARETLENLFASFALMLDRPFTVGDSINAGGIEGSVESVGFRSTRLRTFDGSLVTMPNRLLTSQSLDNLTQRRLRRAKFIIRLAYQTSLESIRGIVQEIQGFIDEHPDTQKEPGVVRFDSFGESSLDIMIIFFVETQQIREFNRIKEEVNLKIIEIVEKQGAKFAFPSRELYIRTAVESHPSSESEESEPIL
ncbi:mechanosensitive ion channel family protein [Rhabdobacter roseus]|uniref:MscS family membrane protein n=1 Tax=Rhabdobacter roseus TaxID=1655419 RepID=A0A840TZ96_9BACT|nr:mechanosensitive ion channel family protein [Rhabdobacter roseus]MBB5286942.1 MscS family membrane protein [Rhabdobacter roseus]